MRHVGHGIAESRLCTLLQSQGLRVVPISLPTRGVDGIASEGTGPRTIESDHTRVKDDRLGGNANRQQDDLEGGFRQKLASRSRHLDRARGEAKRESVGCAGVFRDVQGVGSRERSVRPSVASASPARVLPVLRRTGSAGPTRREASCCRRWAATTGGLSSIPTSAMIAGRKRYEMLRRAPRLGHLSGSVDESLSHLSANLTRKRSLL
jgi:hypothetical protein